MTMTFGLTAGRGRHRGKGLTRGCGALVGILVLGSSFERAQGSASPAAPYATVQVSEERQGEKLSLTFKVVPEGGLVVNEEGPWSLTLTPSSSDYAQKLEKLKFTKGDFDFKVPGVKVTLPSPVQPAEAVSYSLTAFICTADKARCYREVVKAQHTVKKL